MKKLLNTSRIQLGLLMWLLGMVGVFFLLLNLPALLSNQPMPLPMWVIFLIQLTESSVILALTVWTGVRLAYKLNLHAPCIEAFATQKPLLPKLLPQLRPAAIGGIIVGVLLIGMTYVTPELMVMPNEMNKILEFLMRIFYGGITEEIFLRWGVMTLILWGIAAIAGRKNHPTPLLVWIAIIVSSLLFALGHLPAAHILAGQISLNIFLYVMVGNTLAGMVFGFLYQRFGLESAMIAHALAHIVYVTVMALL